LHTLALDAAAAVVDWLAARHLALALKATPGRIKPDAAPEMRIARLKS
jgi:hypothetical protein